MKLQLYELAGADGAVRFSPHCWKARMALAHKGLTAERIPCRFSDKDKLAFSGQDLVPVLVADDTTITDSWNIALFLEEAAPDAPSLFGGEAAQSLARFVNAYANTLIRTSLFPLIAMDIYDSIAEADRDDYREKREAFLGAPLEEVAAKRSQAVHKFRELLDPVRTLLTTQAYLSGDQPRYADYCLFGSFMWARCISNFALLDPDDSINDWRERLLDAFDGMARQAPRSTVALA